MKVGIVTITELDNFGNRLQNYALQTVLQDMGAKVETLPNYVNYRVRRSFRSKAERLIKGILKGDGRKGEVIKQLRFEAFDRKYFPFSADWSDIHSITPDAGDHYDCFVAGSDQIWNPYFNFNWDFNFLTFAPYEKRVAYAASFGVDNVPEEKQSLFTAGLSGMRAISTREFDGSRLVKELTGRDVPVLPDPTLLLTSQRWTQIEKRPGWRGEGKYILVYHLGTKENQRQVVEKLLDAHPEYRGLGVVNIGDPENFRTFSITPDEFLWLVHHAELMVTDSFHGSVFSLLFGTALYYTNRVDDYRSMNSRVQSLSQMLEIPFESDIVDSHIQHSDRFSETLQRHRAAGLAYLKSSVFNSGSDQRKE